MHIFVAGGTCTIGPAVVTGLLDRGLEHAGADASRRGLPDLHATRVVVTSEENSVASTQNRAYPRRIAATTAWPGPLLPNEGAADQHHH